jgi:hypothetical protein
VYIIIVTSVICSCAVVFVLYMGMLLVLTGGLLAPPVWVLHCLGLVGWSCRRFGVLSPRLCVGRVAESFTPGLCLGVVLPPMCSLITSLVSVSFRFPGGVVLLVCAGRGECTVFWSGSSFRRFVYAYL